MITLGRAILVVVFLFLIPSYKQKAELLNEKLIVQLKYVLAFFKTFVWFGNIEECRSK